MSHLDEDARDELPPQAIGVFLGLQLTGWVLIALLDRLLHPPMHLMLALFVAVPLVAVPLVGVVVARLGLATDDRFPGH